MPGTTASPRRSTVPSAKEDFLAKAFRLSPHPIGITELETGHCLEVNDACLEISGFRRDEVVGQTTFMLGIWPDPQERVQFIDRLKAEGKVRNLEVSMRMKNGEQRHFILSTDLITLKGKRCLLTIGNDITERKQAEDALRRSEERWQLAATGATDGIWDWNVAEHTVFLSSRWKQLRGYREAEIGVNETEWSSRIHPEDFSRVMATVQSYFNKEIPTFHCEYRTQRKDGTYFWISDRGVAVWDEQGRVVRMVGSETDITERKQAEAEGQKFVSLADRSLEFIGMCNLDFKPFYVNEAGRRLVGLDSLEQACAVRVQDYFFPEDQAMIIDEFFPSVLRHGHGEVLVRFRHFKTGEALWMDYNVFQVMDENGRVAGYATVSRDITEHKRAEEALRESEERLRILINGARDYAIFMLNTEGQVASWNEGATRVFGYHKEEILGTSQAVFYSEAAVAAGRPARDLQAAAAAADGRYEQDEWHRRKDGSQFMANTIVTALRNEDKSLRGFAVVIRDITERKQAEQALRESEERFRTMAQAVPSFLFETDAAGWNVWTSEGWCRFTGQTPEQVAGHGWAEALHPDDRAANIDRWVQCMKDGIPFEAQQRLRRTDGTYAWVIARALPVRDDHGTIRRWVGSVTNVDDMVLAQEALRELNETLEQRIATRTVALRQSEARFRTFLNNAPNLAFVKACDGRYLYVNRRFEEAFQLEQNEIVGKTDMELFSREQAEQFQSNDRAVLESGAAVEFEETARYVDGLHSNIVVKFPVRDASGHIYAIGGIVTDITDRKRAEVALLQNQLTLQEQRAELQQLAEQLLTAQDSERQRIARDLHDDFSQRLVALTLEVAALERHSPLMPELLGKAVEPVREELAQLADDLRTLAHRLHPSLLNHAGLLPALEDSIQQAMRRTGLHIVLKVGNVPDSLPVDLATCLFRVFQESLQNVAKHAKATEVLVKLSGSSKGVGLSVRDNGTGFDVHAKSSHRKGLGLISMQERLRLQKGFLNIHSRPADGTKVCAWIPFQEATP